MSKDVARSRRSFVSLFGLFILSYSLVHVHFEYRFWLTDERDIFGKYEPADRVVAELAVAKRVYYTKATWMIALVWLQCLGLSFRSAIGWSFLLYGVELLLFFPFRIYTALNLLLALGCVLEDLLRRRKERPMYPQTASALLLLCLPALSCAATATREDGASAGDAPAAATAEAFDAHQQFVTLHFPDSEMDFAFQWIVGSTSTGGCETGEAFATAQRITSGDAVTWQGEWAAMADRVAARGRTSLAAGHEVSARNQLARAANYYRASLISMLADNPSFEPNARKARALLKESGLLWESPLASIEIKWADTVLPGYYRRAPGEGRHPTLIMIGGGETFAEDLVFYIAHAAYERGYNFLTVDLPGQGLMPLYGKPFIAEMEGPLKNVVDYALTRPEVDPQRLAMYGISGGGYFVPRAAMTDKRIRAIAMNSAVVDDHAIFASMPVATATKDVVDSWTSFKRGTIQSIAWRWGVAPDNIPGLVAANEGYVFDPRQITCPALILVGEGEYQDAEVQRQQTQVMDELASEIKKLVVTPSSEGASSHCISENRSVMHQVVFDFFDEVFAGAGGE